MIKDSQKKIIYFRTKEINPPSIRDVFKGYGQGMWDFDFSKTYVKVGWVVAGCRFPFKSKCPPVQI